jgi:diguanylate cyclase (GGDEF)-like protein
MQMNPSYLANIPDTIAMPVMVGFLLSLRNRHPKLDMRSWLVALTFIFVSQATWMVHGYPQMQQTLILTGELLAGLAFASYRGSANSFREFDLVYLVANGVPLVALEAFYGMGGIRPAVYYGILAGALAILAVSTWLRRQAVPRAWLGAGALLLLLLPISLGWFEWVAYSVLAAVYAYAGCNFKNCLPARSVGKIAILTSMVLLSLCYVTHPWVIQHTEYSALADELWRMQKFFVAGGMLLVLVENQSARNQFLAMHDQLTGIPNRRMLDTSLKNEIEWAQRTGGKLTLVMIDLNGFKQVNDTHGHLAGDHVLHEAAKRLRGNLRATELVARMGGDEFVILTRSAVTEEAVQSLEVQLRKWLREPIDWDGKRLWVDGSMGSARFPEDVARWSDDVAQDPPEKLAGALLRIADMRMYAQKPSSFEGRAELEMLFPSRSLLQ